MRHPYITQGLSIIITPPFRTRVPTDKVLANYGFPLCQNLNELNQYSHIENLNGVQYRVPKDAIYEGEERAPSTKIIDTHKKGT